MKAKITEAKPVAREFTLTLTLSERELCVLEDGVYDPHGALTKSHAGVDERHCVWDKINDARVEMDILNPLVQGRR